MGTPLNMRTPVAGFTVPSRDAIGGLHGIGGARCHGENREREGRNGPHSRKIYY